MANKLKCHLRLLGSSDSSVCLSQGNTEMSVSVVGPKPQGICKYMYDSCNLEVTLSRIPGSMTVHDKTFQSTMQIACEKCVDLEQYINKFIKVTVQEIRDKGNLLSVGINASCLALMNSGILMHHLYAAVSCAVTEDENIILHPVESQINPSVAYLTFVFDDSEPRELLTSYYCGQCSDSVYSLCMDKCLAASKDVFDFYEHLVKNLCFSK